MFGDHFNNLHIDLGDIPVQKSADSGYTRCDFSCTHSMYAHFFPNSLAQVVDTWSKSNKFMQNQHLDNGKAMLYIWASECPKVAFHMWKQQSLERSVDSSS